MANADLTATQKRAPNFIDLTGQKFGRLTVIGFAGIPARGRSTWWCKCECTNKLQVIGKNLKRGMTQSCGCLHKERTALASKTHGCTQGRKMTKEYHCWKGMIQRCHNPNAKSYDRYGEKGIFVCNEWRDSFESFYSYMGDAPSSSHSIDRIKNDKGYEPGNVRWATVIEQASNKKTNKYLTFDGRTQTISSWAREFGMKPQTLFGRLNTGWCFLCAVNIPVDSNSKRNARKHVCNHLISQRNCTGHS